MFAESRPEVIEDMRQAADELRSRARGRPRDVRRQPQHQRLEHLHRRLRVLRLRGRQALADAYEHSQADFVRRIHDAQRLRRDRDLHAVGHPSRLGPGGLPRLAAAGQGDRAGDPHARVLARWRSRTWWTSAGQSPHAVFEQLREAGPGQRPRHRRRGAARRRPPAHQPEQAARRALGGDHHRRPRGRAAHHGDRDVRPHRDARRARRAHAGRARAAGPDGRLHRVRAAELHPVPDAARPHARHRRDLARGEPQAHRGLPARAGQDDPVAAGELGQDGPRRRHRGAALGRQRPRRDADGGVDQPHGGRRPRRQARSRRPRRRRPPRRAAPPPSARRCTASAATTTSPPRREAAPRAAAAARGDRRGHGLGADGRRRARSRCARAARRPRASRRSRVEGHHYALVHVTGLPAGVGDAVRGRARRRGRLARAGQPLPAERPAHPHARGPGADRLRLLPRRRAARAAAHAAQGRAPGRPRGRRAARARAAR